MQPIIVGLLAFLTLGYFPLYIVRASYTEWRVRYSPLGRRLLVGLHVGTPMVVAYFAATNYQH